MKKNIKLSGISYSFFKSCSLIVLWVCFVLISTLRLGGSRIRAQFSAFSKKCDHRKVHFRVFTVY